MNADSLILRLRRTLQDTAFFRQALTIAVPIALQNLLTNSLNMVDTIMIGRLGETRIAAAALANQIFFLFFLLLFGISSGSAVFTSQFWGKRDTAGIRKTLGLCLTAAVSGAMVFFVGARFFPELLLSFYSKDPEVIRLGSGYLRIVSFSYLFTAVTVAFATVLRSVEEVKLPLYVSTVSLLMNTVGNFLLIFGVGGFPALGVRGAAIATLAARIFETVLLVGLVYRRKGPAAGKIRELFSYSSAFVRHFFRTALPVIMNEIGWSFGITMYNMVYARIGTESIAAANIADTVGRIAMVFFFGSSTACAVMVGKKIGEGRESTAFLYAKRFSLMAPFLGLIAGAMIAGVAPFVPLLFKVSPVVNYSITRMLTIFGLIFAAKVFNMHIVVGVLRGGGDTRFSLMLDVGFVWLLGVPLAFLGGLVFHLPVYIVYLFVNSEEVVKAVFGFRRLKSGRWIHNLTEAPA